MSCDPLDAALIKVLARLGWSYRKVGRLVGCDTHTTIKWATSTSFPSRYDPIQEKGESSCQAARTKLERYG